jgi:hypothetical protein
MLMVDIQEAALNLEALAETNRAIIEKRIAEDYLDGLSAVEILVRIDRNGNFHRVLRFSVGKEGLQAARDISAKGLT